MWLWPCVGVSDRFSNPLSRHVEGADVGPVCLGSKCSWGRLTSVWPSPVGPRAPGGWTSAWRVGLVPCGVHVWAWM